MKFNIIYEDIFKPAKPEEVKERKKLGELEELKGWCDKNKIKYTEDNKGNIISFDKNTIDKKDNYRETALTWSSGNNFIEMVKLLLENGADVNARGRYKETALTIASYNNNIELVKLLLDNGADVNAGNKYGYTALMWASTKWNKDIVKLLLDNGADVNARDNFGGTSLSRASHGDDTIRKRDIIKLLLKSGARK